VPLIGTVGKLKTELTTADERLSTISYNETTVREQRDRLAQLVASSKSVAAEVSERSRQMQLLSEDLSRSATMKDELLTELERVQSKQREVVGQVQASEDQLTRAEEMFKQLEQRRSQVAFGERK